MIPEYIDCINKRIEVCEYYMTKDCQETCAYAKDIGSFCVKEGMNLRLENSEEQK